MHPFIKEYLEEVRVTKSPVTLREYTARLKRFSKFLGDQNEFTRPIAVQFLDHLKTQKFGACSISLHQSTVRGFYAWMEANGHIKTNVLARPMITPYRSPQRSDTVVFTPIEYARIKSHCLTIQNVNQLFWHDAVIAAWNTGLRLGDIAHLSKSQIQKDKVVVTPRKTQRFSKVVEIPILPELREMIDRNTFEGFLFPEMAQTYDRDGSQALSQQFAEILSNCGITGKSFHGFRHRLTTALLNAGTPIPIISSITGHTIQTMQRYAHSASIQDKSRYMAAI